MLLVPTISLLSYLITCLNFYVEEFCDTILINYHVCQSVCMSGWENSIRGIRIQGLCSENGVNSGYAIWNLYQEIGAYQELLKWDSGAPNHSHARNRIITGWYCEIWQSLMNMLYMEENGTCATPNTTRMHRNLAPEKKRTK